MAAYQPGATPREPFDFAKLQDIFAKYCRDFEKPISKNDKSFALNFAHVVLNEIAPAARFRRNKNEVSKLVFQTEISETVKEPVLDSDGKAVIIDGKPATIEREITKPYLSQVFIGTSQSVKPSHKFETVEDPLCLTLAEAISLAMVYYCKMITYYGSLDEPQYLLTRLAKEVYSEDSCFCLSKHFNIPKVDMFKIVNSSCQPSGQYLPHSNMDCAVAAKIIATETMLNDAERFNLIRETAQQYMAARKVSNPLALKKYLHLGGIPEDLRYHNMIALIDAVQESKREGVPIAYETKEIDDDTDALVSRLLEELDLNKDA